MKTKEQNCTHKQKTGYCPICDGYPDEEYCKSCGSKEEKERNYLYKKQRLLTKIN